MQELDKSKIKVEKVYTKQGEFVSENGSKFNYKTGYIEFMVEDYPMIFKAKIDKPLVDYLVQAYEN